MIEIKQSGLSIATFRQAVQKLDREYRKQVAATWRKHLREAAAYGRGLISGFFGGRGKRLRRAFRFGVSTRGGDVIGRVGYLKSRRKTSAWWIGNIFEHGHNPARRKSSSRAWIPLPGTGSTPAQFFAQYQGQSVVKPGPGGNLIAYRRVEEGALVPMFVLRKSSEIKVAARPVATPTARRFFPIIADATGEAVYSNFRGLK